MTRVQDADDVRFVRNSDEPGVIEVCGSSGGKRPWTLALDVAGMYAERLARPEAFAIDARTSDGELHLIVHARDAAAPVLLPPRELTICDGPRLERSRPGIDRYAVEAARFVSIGGVRCEVRDETATDYELADGRRITKTDLPLAGPTLRVVSQAGWTLRIVQELERHVLAVVHHSAARTLGWSIASTPEGEPVGYRWFARAELDHLAPLPSFEPCSICHDAAGEHRPGINSIDVDRSGECAQRTVQCAGCLATYVVREIGSGTWTWAPQRPRQRAGTPRPAPRVERAAPVAAPAPAPEPPSREPMSYDISRHTCVERGEHQSLVEVVGEGATTISLRSAGTIDKLDSEIGGPFLYWVRFQDQLLRVIEADGPWLMVVCHPSLGSTLGFARAVSGDDRISYRWVAERDTISVGDALASETPAPVEHAAPVEHPAPVERPAPIAPVPIAAPTQGTTIRQPTRDEILLHDHIRFRAPTTGERQLVVCGETPTTITVSFNGSTEDRELIAAGFQHEEREHRTDPYEPGEIYHHHELVLGKLDPRLVGPFRSRIVDGECVLRVIDEAVDSILVVCHYELGHQLGFNETAGNYWAWLPRDRTEAPRTSGPRTTVEPARTATLSPAQALMTGRAPTDERLAEHAAVEIAGHRAVIQYELADRWHVAVELDAADATLEPAGFTLDPADPRMGSLETFRYTALLDKLDRWVTGPFLYCVRFAGHVVRAIDEDHESVLLVCHPDIGPALDFHRRDLVSFRWVKKAGVEELRVPRDPRIEPAPPLPDPRTLARAHACVELAGHRLQIGSETATRLVLVDDSGYESRDLLALGFSSERYESDHDPDGRTRNLDYEGLRVGYSHRLEIDKLDPRLTGPFLAWTRWQGHLMRVAAKRAEQVLLVTCDSRIGSQARFERVLGLGNDTTVYSRWVAHTDLASTVASAPPTQVDDDGYVRFVSPETGERRVRVESETATTLSLRHDDSAMDRALVAAGFEAREVTEGASWANDYSPEPRCEHRLVVDRSDPRVARSAATASTPTPPTPTPQPTATEPVGHGSWPADAPPLDDDLRGELEPHTYLHGPYSRLRITAETADSFTLAGGAGPMLVLKGDPKYTGHHLYYVRHAGQLLRVARALPGHVLAIVHASLGGELGFPTLVTSGTESLAGQWLPRRAVEKVVLDSPDARAPRPDKPSSYDVALIRQASDALSVSGRRVRVVSETADRFVVETSHSRDQDDGLVAGGWVESVEYDDRYGAPEYQYRLDCAKSDPRVSAGELVEYRGYQLRAAARRNGRVLLIADSSLKSELGFEEHAALAYRWVPEAELIP